MVLDGQWIHGIKVVRPGGTVGEPAYPVGGGGKHPETGFQIAGIGQAVPKNHEALDMIFGQLVGEVDRDIHALMLSEGKNLGYFVAVLLLT